MVVSPLNPNVPIADPKTGLPTPEFQRWWVEQAELNVLVRPMRTQAEISAIIDDVEDTTGAVLYRGSAVWDGLVPGTDGYVLTTHGVGEVPTWGAPTFLKLTDTPAGFAGFAGKAVKVNAGGTALEFGEVSTVVTFLDLTDTPAAYTSKSGYVPVVNAGETALEFAAISASTGTAEYAKLYSQDFATTNLTTTPVEVVNIDAYDELVIVLSGIVNVGAGVIAMQLSADGGSTWISSGYHRTRVDSGASGSTTSNTFMHLDELASASAGGGIHRLRGHRSAVIMTIMSGQGGRSNLMVADEQWLTAEAVHDALRFYQVSGTATAGTINIYGINYSGVVQTMDYLLLESGDRIILETGGGSYIALE